MVYIHQLSHLNPKAADLESVYLIREIKEKTPYPVQTEQLQDYCADLLVSATDKEMAEHAFFLLQPTMDAIMALAQQVDPIHEPINLHRALDVLKELPAPLHNNIAYMDAVISWQHNFFLVVVPALNTLGRAQSKAEKASSFQQLNPFFEKILRNNQDIRFNSGDIINEACLNHSTGLNESMSKGFLFHVSLEEELKKLSYEELQKRIPVAKLQEIEHIRANIEVINKGVERAYAVNMRMVQLAVVLYSYVKWLGSKSIVMG